MKKELLIYFIKVITYYLLLFLLEYLLVDKYLLVQNQYYKVIFYLFCLVLVNPLLVIILINGYKAYQRGKK
ncbi:MAG: hypothetical protein SPI53_02995 [Erysipelotrichaceae bacterium]|nr:hypothetical protein [Erysipelotrichaceae bacterium]